MSRATPYWMIEWLDSQTPDGGGWKHNDDMRADEGISQPITCISVGFIVWETDSAIVIAHSYHSDHEQHCGHLTIPKTAIVLRKKLGTLKIGE